MDADTGTDTDTDTGTDTGTDAETDTGGRARFDTPLGQCGIAWSSKGLTRFDLPGHGEKRTEAARAGRPLEALGEEMQPSNAPAWVREAMELIRRHLGGNPQDLSVIPTDMDGISPFFRRVYEAARSIPAGETLSYAELAERAGSPKAFRAVGQAMAKNPLPVVVPCHRVLAAGGKLGGFSAPGGTTTKVRLLKLER
ncbi:MAG: methylated-DNA--[protein]-cysteine S-methyltransferase [Polyangiaceae bacterium]|nr:methylated-DNA--[protein]-cysteine S-methyltransferase [Polyangiaceae bacterium]